MEGTAARTPVVTYLAEVAGGSAFTLVDIGCSGGIHPVWRRFGPRLRAIGIDPNLYEVDRLRKAEMHPGVRYVSGFAGLPADHAFRRKKEEQGDRGRNPWYRVSTAKAQEILRSRSLSSSEQTEANLWLEMELADRSQVIAVPDYLRDNCFETVDFLKIDIDGRDFDVLNSFDSALDSLGILGLSLEVNFFGSARETDHTFHNTDRFMKAKGFELFDLTLRRYSLAALPSRYVLRFPAQTEFGRILQGDALYARDLGNPEYQELAARLGPEKLLNLVCVFAIFNLPDCAADIALRFRERLSRVCDVDHVLDLLAEQAQGSEEKRLSYRELLDRFEAQDAMFFPDGWAGTTVPSGMEVATLSLQAFVPVAGQIATNPGSDGCVTIRTNATPYNYAATLAIPDDLIHRYGDCAARFKVRLRVDGGPVGLGILGRGAPDAWLCAREVRTTDGHEADVYLAVAQVKEARSLVVYTGQDKSPGVVGLASITLEIRTRADPDLERIRNDSQRAEEDMSGLRSELGRVLRDRDRAWADLQSAREKLRQVEYQAERAHGTIAAVERNKFWRLGRLWFRLKRWVGLGG